MTLIWKRLTKKKKKKVFSKQRNQHSRYLTVLISS